MNNIYHKVHEDLHKEHKEFNSILCASFAYLAVSNCFQNLKTLFSYSLSCTIPNIQFVSYHLNTTSRGFTGHEHYPWTKIINMNGRLYDPVIARFFSPDQFVQAPEFSQSFNRYSYCLNNPLKYVDPTGQRYVDVDDNYDINARPKPLFLGISGKPFKTDFWPGGISDFNMGGKENAAMNGHYSPFATKYVNQKGELLYETDDGLSDIIVVPDGNIRKLENKLYETYDNGTINDPETNRNEMHTLGTEILQYQHKFDAGDIHDSGFKYGYEKAYNNKTSRLADMVHGLFGLADGGFRAGYEKGKTHGTMEGLMFLILLEV